MKAKELKELSEGELKDKYEETKKELMKENAQVASGTTPKNPGQIRLLKKNIARILTIFAERKVNKHE